MPPAKEDLDIKLRRGVTYDTANSQRVCLSRSLPLCFIGATPPRPDPGHFLSLACGIIKRFGYQPPKIDRRTKRKFRKFVKMWLKRNVKKLTDADIPSFEEWISSTPYSEARKNELRGVWADYLSNPKKRKVFNRVKSFVKDETYDEYKYCRLINSRVDVAKCFFGPINAAVSDVFFKMSWFIKKVPVPDRPEVLGSKLFSTGAGVDYIFTDYTAFEAHFVKEFMEICEYEVFYYMTSGLDGGAEFMQTYRTYIMGVNKLIFKDLSVKIEATRMSGEMFTSIANGISNLLIFLFVCQERGATSVVGFVEGDDGLFRVSPAKAAPTIEDFKKLGFTIKIGHTMELNKASFCGQVYGMQDKIVITDPKEVMARFGWTNKKYTSCSEETAMQLLRAKGYSMVYQYNGCPILDSLGRRILQLTENVTIGQKVFNNLDLWEREKLIAATQGSLPEKKTPGDETRNMVEELYGITVEQQYELEEYVSTIDLGLHNNPLPLESMPSDWVDYYNRYTLDHKVSNPMWMNKSEGRLRSRLAKYKCCAKVVV